MRCSIVFTLNPHLSFVCLHKFKSTSVTNRPSLTLDKPFKSMIDFINLNFSFFFLNFILLVF